MTLPIKELLKLAPELSVMQLAILLEIQKRPRIRMVDIADNLGLKQTTVHFHVHTLELGNRDRRSFDLIRIEKAKDDRRFRWLTLTSTGDQIASLISGRNGSKPRCDKTDDWVANTETVQAVKKPISKSLFD